MVTISTNIDQFVIELKDKLNVFQEGTPENDTMLRTITTTLTGLMRKRIHVQGLASDGQAIGTYSPGYMKVRTGSYGKGDKGVFTRGVRKGQARPNYNRTSDSKVILSLTRQMENDLAVCEQDPFKTERGYGIGYRNIDNYNKSLYAESTYRKRIFSLTEQEKQAVYDIATHFIENAINNKNS